MLAILLEQTYGTVVGPNRNCCAVLGRIAQRRYLLAHQLKSVDLLDRAEKPCFIGFLEFEELEAEHPHF